MRSVFLVIAACATLGAQSMVETSAAAAGGAVGGVAGKKVSDAVTNILNKVDKTAAKAAADKARAEKEKNEPMLEVGPGVPHNHAAGAKAEPKESVPPPPPVRHAARHSAPPPPPAPEPVAVPAPEPPPAPPITATDLRTIAVGATRDDVVKLGIPSARVTMFDDGHVLEVFRYVLKETDIGTVRLTDGAVSSVQVH
jgi:hypothetical protein